MGTSLFNTTPAATYPALLKVGNNTTLSATLKTLSDGLGNDSTLQLSTRRLGILQDTGVTTQVSSVIQATTTNANLVIAPNGTGALVASIPDGTATGGNARGSRAVDFSLSRLSNTSVASGNNSAILAGYNNRASGSSSSICGGDNNIASNQYTHIGGGTQNTTSGEFSTIAGGFLNTASSNLSTISGGQSNTASTGTHATVVGGQSNVSSGQYAVSGGFSNTASGESAVAFGRSNIASSQKGVSMGFNNNNNTGYGVAIGSDNTVTQGAGSFYSVAIGTSNTISGGGSRNYIFGEENSITASGIRNTAIGHASSVSGTANNAMAINGGGARANNSLGKGLNCIALYYNGETRGGGTIGGNAASVQTSDLIAFNSQTVTSGGTFQLYLDGAAAAQLITVATTAGLSKRSWNLQVRWVTVVKQITGTATGVSVDDTKVSTDLLAVRRNAAGTIAVSPHTSAGTQVIETIAGSLTTANVAYSAGGSSNLVITFTAPTFSGGGSLVMDIVAALEITELGF